MSDLQQWVVKESWLALGCSLGEGPFYEKETNSVRFVDINKHRLHTVPVDGDLSSVKTIQLDVPITVTSDIEGVDPQDRLLVGLKYGTAVLDRKTGKYEMLTYFHDPPNENMRSNDGSSDPNGRFWVGTMKNVEPMEPAGCLYIMDSKGGKEEYMTNLTIPNGIAWSPDQRTMYFTHTTSAELFAMDYDPSTGAVSNRRVFYNHKGPGSLDGFRVDVDGNIWHAVYGGSRVLKITPDAKLVGEIILPTRNITCAQFVGTELVMTSAADEKGEGRSKELGGSVFRVDVGTTGLELFKYKM